jgi:hypothetical protein
MKAGKKCFVCYDGKYGRRVVGEIIASGPGKILVRFKAWSSDDETIIEHWFRKHRRGIRFGGPRYIYAGYVPVKDSLMKKMFSAPGDWYRVLKFKEKDALSITHVPHDYETKLVDAINVKLLEKQ